jgi:hypothetical protein
MLSIWCSTSPRSMFSTLISCFDPILTYVSAMYFAFSSCSVRR